MHGKRSRSRFWIRVIVSCLTCIFIFGLAPCTFQVQTAYASPGSYSKSFDGVTFTVEGAEFWFTFRENISTNPAIASHAVYYFYAYPGHEITVTASKMASDNKDFLSYEFLDFHNPHLNMDQMGSNEPLRTLHASGSFIFNGTCGIEIDAYDIQILVSFEVEPTVTPSTEPAQSPTQTPSSTLSSTPSPTPTSSQSSSENEIWTVNYVETHMDTFPMWAHGEGSINDKAEVGTKLGPNDLLIVPPNSIIVLKNTEGTKITITKCDHVKIVSAQAIQLQESLQSTLEADLFLDIPSFDESTSGANPKLRVETPDAIITDSGTQFEVRVDDTGTEVATFSGSVYVTDINSTYLQIVGENQTTSIPRGGYPSNPITFNAAAVDHWWDTLASPTSTPAGGNLFASTGLLPYIAVAGVLVIVAVAGVVWSKRKKTKTQVSYPPPPPPPNAQQTGNVAS